MSAHYDRAFYEGTNLKYWAAKYAEVLPKEVTHLVSHGISGASIASGILMLKPELYHVSARGGPISKRSRSGANKDYSGIISGPSAVYCFVDDFMATGGTFEFVKRWAKRVKKEYTWVPLEIKYVLTSNISDKVEFLKKHSETTFIRTK